MRTRTARRGGGGAPERRKPTTPQKTHIRVVAAGRQPQHLVKVAQSREQPAQAPKRAPADRAAAHAAVALGVHLDDAHAGADVDEQVGEDVAVGCFSVVVSVGGVWLVGFGW